MSESKTVSINLKQLIADLVFAFAFADKDEDNINDVKSKFEEVYIFIHYMIWLLDLFFNVVSICFKNGSNSDLYCFLTIPFSIQQDSKYPHLAELNNSI